MILNNDSSVEMVDSFCCLGDVLSVDGSANAAVTVRILSGENKLRQ